MSGGSWILFFNGCLVIGWNDVAPIRWASQSMIRKEATLHSHLKSEVDWVLCIAP